MKKIKQIEVNKTGVKQTLEEKLEVLRLKINEIIEELNKSRQIKKEDSDGSDTNHLGTRSKSGEENKQEKMPEDVDNQSAEIVSKGGNK